MKFLLLTALLFSSTLHAQTPPYKFLIDSIPIDNSSGLVKYEGEEKVLGKKEDLFAKTKIWLSQAFSNSYYVTLSEDKDLCCVTGKIILPYNYAMYYNSKSGYSNTSGEAHFTIQIFSTRNKYRYVILIWLKDSFSRNAVPWSKNYMNALFSNPAYTKTYYSLISEVNIKMNNIITSLKNKMNPDAKTTFK